VEKGILKIAHIVIDERLGEPVAIAEAVKHCAFADAGRGRHGLHCQGVGPVFGQQSSCRAQDALAIGGCVTAFARLPGHRELAWLHREAACR
jgi:hypothetical protein